MAVRKITPRAVDADTYRRISESVLREWGDLCLRRRLALHLTLRQAADLTHGAVTFQTLHKIEQAEIMPREHVKVAIAHAYVTGVHDLFPPLTHGELLKRLRVA